MRDGWLLSTTIHQKKNSLLMSRCTPNTAHSTGVHISTHRTQIQHQSTTTLHSQSKYANIKSINLRECHSKTSFIFFLVFLSFLLLAVYLPTTARDTYTNTLILNANRISAHMNNFLDIDKNFELIRSMFLLRPIMTKNLLFSSINFNALPCFFVCLL